MGTQRTSNNENDTEKLLSFFALSAGDEPVGNTIQLLPHGWINTAKGRFLVDDAAMNLIIQAFGAKKNDTVIDYEHQTLKDVIAPAAAWIVAPTERRAPRSRWICAASAGLTCCARMNSRGS